MNGIREFIGNPILQRIGWMLLHSLWQGALIAGGFEVVRFLLRRRSAQSRYVAGCCALALLMMAPVITFTLQRANHSPAVVGTVGSTGGTVTVARTSAEFATVSQTPASTFRNATALLNDIAPWLTAAWLAGVALFAGRLTRSCWWVGKIRRRNQESVEQSLLDKLDVLRRRLGISRPVRLLKSALVEVPAVVGWLKPVILLPAASLTGLTPQQLEAILAHELAHVRRFDYVVNAFQCVVETLMFYHPAVWWISRSVREEREHCCDDIVVQVCGDRVGYARALATLEGARADVPDLAFAATGGSLLNRVRRLVGIPSDNQPATPSELGGIVLLAIGVLLIATGVFWNLQPTVYRSSARLRLIDPVEMGIQRADHPTEIETLQSDAVLADVSDELGLASKWGVSKSEAVERLRGRIQVEPVPGSPLVDLHVFGDSAEEAMRTANRLPDAYRTNRQTQIRAQISDRIRASNDAKKKDDAIVEAQQKEVDRLRKELNINETDPMSLAPTPIVTPEALRLLQQQLISAQGLQGFQENQLTTLMKLDQAKLREVIQIFLEPPDTELNTLSNEFHLEKQKLQLLERAFSKEHPACISQKNKVDELDKKINDRVAGILIGLETRLGATRFRVAEMTDFLERGKTNDLPLTEKTRPYYVAKQKLYELRQFNMVLGMRIASQQTELVLPRALPGIVVKSAALGIPVSPNRLVATALIGMGLITGIGGRFLVRDKRYFAGD